MSKIEWTEQTWNPIVGCSIVSPGCTHCYAMRQAARVERMAPDKAPSHYSGTTRMVNGRPVWTGKLALAPERIVSAPLRRRKPTTWFVNSMGDLFHEDVPDEWIDRVFAIMALTPRHTYQVLTKRAERMRRYLLADRRAELCAAVDGLIRRRTDESRRARDCLIRAFQPTGRNPLPNVWLGVSAEDQQRADERIPHLIATPAALRFVSCEPLLGPLDLTNYIETCHGGRDGECNWPRCPQNRDGEPETSGRHCPIDTWRYGDEEPSRPRLDWVIVGGESGLRARPMHPDWARGLRDQCAAAGTAFFFKQWGEWGDFTADPSMGKGAGDYVFGADGRFLGAGCNEGGSGDPNWRAAGGAWMSRVGKSRAGALLDGVEHRQWPDVRP